MILSKKEKEQLSEMIALEKIVKDKEPLSEEGMEAAKKWHSYPQKLKNMRLE